MQKLVAILFFINSLTLAYASKLLPNKHELQTGKELIELSRLKPGSSAWKKKLLPLHLASKRQLLFVPYEAALQSLVKVTANNKSSCAHSLSRSLDPVAVFLNKQMNSLCLRGKNIKPFRKRTPSAFLKRRKKFYYRMNHGQYNLARKNFDKTKEIYLKNTQLFSPQKAWAFFITMGKKANEKKQWSFARDIFSFTEKIYPESLSSKQETYFQTVWSLSLIHI